MPELVIILNLFYLQCTDFTCTCYTNLTFVETALVGVIGKVRQASDNQIELEIFRDASVNANVGLFVTFLRVN